MTVFLRMLYLRTEQDLLKELNRLRENGFVEYGTYASLMRVQAILQNMQDESFQYVPAAVNKIFNDTNKRLGYEAAEALSTPQTAIAEQLTANLLGNINEAAETAFRTSERIMQIGRLHPDAFRNPTIEASLLREVGGGVGETSVEHALKVFNTQNVTAFVDKSGREWGLTEYCTMATRTVSKQAITAAEMTADDWDLWKIIGNGITCSLCAAYQGRVYSKSGTNPDYPPLAAAFGKIDPAGGNDLSNTYLNIHPNCMCSLVRYTTAGRTEKEIERDKEFSSFEKRPANVDYRSKKAVAAYREKEKARADFLETRRQWNEYRERLGDKIPSLETFEKHKKAGDEKYKKWMKEYRAKGAEIRKTMPKPEPKPPTISELNEKMTERLTANYEANRTEHNLNLATAEQLKNSPLASPIQADFAGMDVRSAEAVSDTLSGLMREYESPLSKIVPMEKTEAFMRRTVPASTSPDMRTASAEMRLNPNIMGDYDGYIDRVSKAVKSGQFPDIPESKFAQYVPTHEFAHSMLSMTEQIPTAKTNWSGMDYTRTRKARREIEGIYKEYQSELGRLETRKNGLYGKFFDGTITEKERDELLAVEKKIKAVTVSKYASKDPDEFMAEAFADARLGNAPSEYSRRVEAVLKKHFGKR